MLKVVITRFYRSRYKSEDYENASNEICKLVTNHFLSRKYHSHKTLKETLFKLETDFPDIAEVQNLKHTKIILYFSLSVQVSLIGTSVQGRELLVLRITEGVKKPRPLLRPQV